jgi:cellulose synthase/poly-beta-1,6-N-acetylglucosamine synthase-like glycosyltransferase
VQSSTAASNGKIRFALQQTAEEAALIGVVDADYETAPEFLAEVVDYFEDGQIAFVQTPQDYRDWSSKPFPRMCYWEYWQVFAVSMKLRDRSNAIPARDDEPDQERCHPQGRWLGGVVRRNTW